MHFRKLTPTESRASLSGRCFAQTWSELAATPPATQQGTCYQGTCHRQRIGRIRAAADPCRRRGFTLIEILVVVIILGLVSAIIVPQIGSHNDLNAESGARQLMADLLYAQSRAVATQKKHYIQFNLAGNSYRILDSLSPANVITQPVLQAPYQIILNTGTLAGVTLGAVNFDTQTTLAFDELGTPYSYSTVTSTLSPLNSGAVNLVCGSHTSTVTVMPYSGEILVQ